MASIFKSHLRPFGTPYQAPTAEVALRISRLHNLTLARTARIEGDAARCAYHVRLAHQYHDTIMARGDVTARHDARERRYYGWEG